MNQFKMVCIEIRSNYYFYGFQLPNLKKFFKLWFCKLNSLCTWGKTCDELMHFQNKSYPLNGGRCTLIFCIFGLICFSAFKINTIYCLGKCLYQQPKRKRNIPLVSRQQRNKKTNYKNGQFTFTSKSPSILKQENKYRLLGNLKLVYL